MPIAGSGSDIRAQAVRAIRERARRPRPTPPAVSRPSPGAASASQTTARRRQEETLELRRRQQAARLQHGFAPPTQRAPGQGRRPAPPPRRPGQEPPALGPAASIIALADATRLYREISRPHGPTLGHVDPVAALGEEWQRLYTNRRAALQLGQTPEQTVNPEAPAFIQQQIRETHEAALADTDRPVTLAGLGSLEPTGLARRTIGQVLGSLLYTPAGLYMLGEAGAGDIRRALPGTAGGPGFEATRGVGKAIAQGIAADVTNPRENLGYLLMDVWGLAGAGAGLTSRAGAAVRAGSVRPLLEGVRPGRRQIAPGLAPELEVPRSTSALGRAVESIPRRLGFQGGPGLTRNVQQRIGFERGQRERRIGDIERASAEGLRARAGRTPLGRPRTSRPAQAAIRAVAEQTPLDLRILRHRADIAKARAALAGAPSRQARARLNDQIGRLESKITDLERADKLGYVVQEEGRLRVSDDLREAYELTRASAQRGEQIDIQLGRLEPEQAAARIEKPGQFFREGTDVADMPAEFFTTYSSRRPTISRALPGNERIMGVPRLTGHQEFTGGAITHGTFRDDVMRATADVELSRLRDRRKLRLWETAKAESISPDEWRALPPDERANWRPVRTDITDYSPENRRFLQDLYDQQDAGPALTRAERRELGDEIGDLEDDLFEHMFPPTRTAMATEEGQFRFYDKRTMPQKRITARKDPTVKKLESVGELADIVNQLASTSLLFTKGTGYIAPNAIGQIALLAMRQGLAAPLNLLARGPALVRRLTPERRARLRAASGSGLAQSLGPITSPSKAMSRVHRAVGGAYGKVLDDPWRDASFVYEARKLGYKGRKEIEGLLDSAEGTPAFDDLLEVGQRVDRAMGEFGRMGQFEQDVVRRLVFFYPWLKASTMLTARLPLDKPVTSAALGQIGRYGQEQTEQQLGEGVAAAIPGVFPTGDVDEEGNPRVIDPRAVAIFQSPSDIAAVTSNLLGQGGSRQGNIGGYFTPAVSMGLAAGLHYDPFRQRTYPEDMTTPDIALEELKGLTPYTLLAERLAEPGVQENRLYGYSRGDALRQVIAGSQSPRSLNMETAENIAEDIATSQLSPTRKRLRDHWQYRDAVANAFADAGFPTGTDMPKPLNDAVMLRAKIAAARSGLRETLDLKGNAPIPIKDKAKAELRVYANNGIVDKQTADQAASAIDAMTDEQAQEWYDEEIGSLWEQSQEPLREVVAELRDRGIGIEGYSDYYPYLG